LPYFAQNPSWNSSAKPPFQWSSLSGNSISNQPQNLPVVESFSFTVQARWGEVATAQSANTTQLVQQGIERYKTGDVQGANRILANGIKCLSKHQYASLARQLFKKN
jgi:hypothetical protein